MQLRNDSGESIGTEKISQKGGPARARVENAPNSFSTTPPVFFQGPNISDFHVTCSVTCTDERGMTALSTSYGSGTEQQSAIFIPGQTQFLERLVHAR